MTRQDYYISGMDCAEEVGAIEREFTKLRGIESTSFDVLRSRMSVTFNKDQVSEDEIRKAVARAGLRADNWQTGHSDRHRDWGRLTAITVSAGLLVVALGFHVSLFGWEHVLGQESDVPLSWWIPLLYIGSALAGAWYVIPRAISSACALRPDMNLLMTIAVAGALGIGEWFEAASVAFLFALSLALERWSVGRARRAVEALMNLTPPEARVRDISGSDRVVPVEEVLPDQIVIVRPGDRMPLDGIVSSGTSWVNQAPVTGESLPVSRSPGDEVFAGSINGDGALEVKVSRPASESLLARVARLVEEARLKRSGHEKWVDHFARIYTPIVILLALCFLLMPPLGWGAPWAASFYNALVLLVIACPCALVISTPVSVIASLASAARQGVLIKSGIHVESPAKLSTIAFDKTGTITTGELKVKAVVPMSGYSTTDLIQIAAALEQTSTHPLALAITRYAAGSGIQPGPAKDLQNLPGKGAEGNAFGKRHWIGSHKLLLERAQDTPNVQAELDRLAKDCTVVAVGNENHVCGFFTLSDEIHPDTQEVIGELRSLGIERIIMLTGDNYATANAIAANAGIKEAYAELLPEDKARLVAELTTSVDGAIAMVGDGINDAPAMATATVGIAMGGKATDVAMETADIVIMTDCLKRLPWLVRHARRTISIIRLNIAMALLSKAIFVVLAALGLATLWMAIIADMGVSLLAVFNALRILRVRNS